MIVPTWCGPPEKGEARLAQFFRLGTLLAGTVDAMPYGASLAVFDPFLVTGQRVFMETCWLPALDSSGIDAFIQAIATAVSPSSPTNSGAPPREYRRRRRPSAFAATMCSSRFALRLSIVQSRLTSSDIGSGFKRLMRPLVPWRFRVDTQTCSPAEIRNAQQKAMAATLNAHQG
jgi:hypothetical protein